MFKLGPDPCVSPKQFLVVLSVMVENSTGCYVNVCLLMMPLPA